MHFPVKNLHHILFLDIETATVINEYEALDDRMKSSWNKKAQKFASLHEYPLEEEEIAALYHDKAAIFAEYSKVICLSMGVIVPTGEGGQEIRLKSLSNADERDLLIDFSAILQKNYFDPVTHFLCGHNIREFDLPFLCRRYLINGLPLPNLLNLAGSRPWQITHLLDTLELWKFGDYKHYVSLDLLCAALNIDSPKDAMSGDQVNVAYWSGRLNEIVQYCEKDVVATAKVYLKCNGLPFFEKVTYTGRSEEE